ncbi:MAG: hydroxymethylglutaryl-CoA lyase [Candidatus Nanopelagicales bacterium]|nr:hydroxymethylglutaryl-CoA lyase [Candidatus Nanopelagicales bacterium]
MSADERVELVEVSARDGLQNDAARLSTEQKVELVARCAAAGLRRAEIASFVNPRLVPQMADGEAVVAGVRASVPGPASWIGLVLNTRGFHRAAAAGVDEVNCVVGVSEEFSHRNQGMGTDDAIAVVAEVAPLARAAGIVPTVTLSVAFGCPFSGEVPMDRLRRVVDAVAATGVAEVALADTIGVAVPSDVAARVAATRALTGDLRLRAHFHNTRNTGYANALAAADAGVSVLDASLGGIGGCPFAPRATGNIATEDLVYALHRSGYQTGVDLDAAIAASAWLGELLGRDLPAYLPRAGVFPAVATV